MHDKCMNDQNVHDEHMNGLKPMYDTFKQPIQQVHKQHEHS